jgi:hypothetical protein
MEQRDEPVASGLSAERTPKLYRFSREVSEYAPKPGHHLATASCFVRNEVTMLWVIEGPANNAISFRSMATESESIALSRFSIVGSLVEQLSELPHNPFEQRVNIDFSFSAVTQGSKTGLPKSASIVFTATRAPNGVDPDGAIISVAMDNGEQAKITVTDFRRGWWGLLVIPLVALAGCAGETSGHVKVETPFGKVEGDFSHKDGVAPQTSK